MECAYGVGITNRFSRFLLSDESDNDDESKKEAEVIDNKTNTTKSTAGKDLKKPNTDQKPGKQTEKEFKSNKENAKGAPNTVPSPKGRPETQDQNLKPRADDRNSGKNNGGVGNEAVSISRVKSEPFGRNDRNADYGKGRNNFRNDSASDCNNFGPDRGFGEVTSGRGGRGNRGGYGQRPLSRGREFDRKSGSDRSGVKPVDKKDGAGQRNWGSYKEDAEAEEPTVNDLLDVDSGEAPEEKPNGNANETEPKKDSGEPGEEPMKLMTLDEYKALQTNQRQKPVFKVRKAGEGEDRSWMKKMTLVKKESIEGEDEEEAEEDDDDEEFRRIYGRQKKHVEIQFEFADSHSRRGFGRGGRGGQRGFRGGGTGAGDRNFGGDGDREIHHRQIGASQSYEPRNPRGRQFRQYVPRVDDLRDFPALC